jgi:hypothetical protein
MTVPNDQSAQSAQRRDNGLDAPSFVPLVEVDAALGDRLLSALGRARIAAYLDPIPDPNRRLLYAAAADRADARTIVERVGRAATEPVPAELTAANPADAADAGDSANPGASGGPVNTDAAAISAPDLLQGRDANSEFQALVADWHVDTVAAIRSAERDLNREDADWRARISPPPPAETDEEEHFVPPPPPPLPRLAGTTIGAIVIIALSIFIFASGDWLGLGEDLTFLTGIGGILLGAGMLVMKLRPTPDEEDDDGAIL